MKFVVENYKIMSEFEIFSLEEVIDIGDTALFS